MSENVISIILYIINHMPYLIISHMLNVTVRPTLIEVHHKDMSLRGVVFILNGLNYGLHNEVSTILLTGSLWETQHGIWTLDILEQPSLHAIL